MKNLLITESEKNRILNLHSSITKNDYLIEQTTGTTINGCPSFNSDWYKNVYDMGFTTMGYQWEPVLSKKMGSSKESICSCFKSNPNYGENSDEYYDMCA